MAETKSARKTLREYCESEARFAFLISQWHTLKNGALTPDDVSPSSRTKVWWICENGHAWQTQVASRRYGGGCPICLKQSKKQNCKAKQKKIES